MCGVLLLLLLLRSSQTNHFYGTVMTFTPQDLRNNGSVTVVCRYKTSFRSCSDGDAWDCAGGDCGSHTLELSVVDTLDGDWCQKEGVMRRRVPDTEPFQLRLSGGDWMSGVRNGVRSWLAITRVDLRVRSDLGQPNRSPQTTVLPALRVPSNCRRDFDLLAFDPDGDEVKCRYGDAGAQECNPCRPPSLLTLSPSCTLTFHSSSSSSEGPYAVQVEMEDFPKQNISLLQRDGVKITRTPSDALSKIPLRFALIVDPAVPSCTDGLYLPKFLPPSPASRAQLVAFVNQNLEITIKAEATSAQVSGVFFSGPHGTTKQEVSEGHFLLNWTPPEGSEEETHPMCFVVRAVKSSLKYHSELRCVVVTVQNEPTTARPTTLPPTTTTTATAPTSSQSTWSQEPDLMPKNSVKGNHAGKVWGLVIGAGLSAVVLTTGVWAVRRYVKARRAGI